MRWLRAGRVLGLVSLLAGCAEAGPPFTLVFDQGVSEAEIAAVMAGAEDWNAHVGTPVFRRGAMPANECDAIAVHVRALPERPFALAVTTSHACGFDLTYTPDALADATTIRHELGHTLGLPDVYDPRSVMHKTDTPWPTEILPEDAAWVRAHWDL